MKKLISFPHMIALYLLVYFVIITIVPLLRWQQYEMTYFDHGIYDHALWKASQFKAPTIDHLESRPLNQLGDHFTLLMYVMLPLYWITSSYIPVFIVQSILVTISIAIVVHIAWKRLKNPWAMGMILVSTTGFIGLQNALIGDFHADILGMFPLAVTLFYLDKRQWKPFYVWLFILFLGKESFSIIGLGLACYLWFIGEKKHACLVGAVSSIYMVIVTKFIMPWLADRDYQYTNQLPSLQGALERFFLPIIKTKTMFVTLLTFGFLPLLAPAFLPVILQDWIIRFVFNLAGTRFDLGMHYNSLITLLLAYGAILGFERLQRFKESRKIIPYFSLAVIVGVLVVHQFWYRGPLGLALNKAFYVHTNDFGFLNKLVAEVPKGGLVMASNNLAVRLTHTNEVILFRKNYKSIKPLAIVLDIREGQNPNAIWPLTYGEVLDLHKSLVADPDYSMNQIGKDQFIFVRN